MSEETQAAAGAAATETTEGSLLEEILGATQMKPSDDGYDVARKGVHAFIAELLAPTHQGAKIDKAIVDGMIVEIDKKLSKQLDAILHQPAFQKLESAWRGLKFVVDRTNFRENIKVELLNVSKEDLQADFEDAPEVTKSGLYKIAYTAEYGTFGGKPYGAMFSNYEFGPGAQDVELLRNCASVAAMAHAPFFAAAGASFFGQKDMLSLPNLKDLASLFEGPQYTKWNSFRDTEDARYVGLLMPRFLLRLPYGENTVPVKRFNYAEDCVDKHEEYLWGNASYAMATRLADSFAKYRWCPNIIGPQAGGTVENLPLHQYQAMGEIQTKTPTEIMLSERREFELSEQGFIALTFRKDSDNAAFFSANSAQRPKTFGNSPEGKAAELNYRLGTQLPYIFVACRIAHYLKVIQREQIGTSKEAAELESELNQWIGQYVVDQDGVSPYLRGIRPLRQAQISVSEVPGNAGFYKVDMKVRPHFKYMGASFTLSLVGKLDKG
ncbi:MAG: type VI secretion system contractile sheath large subunit [Labilithrix sp.]|nr:type VI secretion system contractile sheath large subunit [Labilithrix sp.]MCW5833033.1 type VI secretion system contractile sheath large subunit [Labilithrix sp.]